ncbi:hypothetical protein M407DRAFT_236278 [Tulasnella calospora MUT 4182]|uniref:F-box domain-containing protein n=1 Tax=Tulasnella calospora MUT 4182 TaxID=1051891 RepID=A0A0C3QHC5_9AGAM|nr:hypothetical protein M407DRAFT_236278 [Tulasnella calospora MUT 4182]
MASAGKFLGVPAAAQTDVFGGQATLSPVPEISNNPPSALQSGPIYLDPLSILPLELVEFIFQCSSLALELGLEFVDEVPCLSHLRLVALKIFINVDPATRPADVIPFARKIEISDEALENIRAIDLTLFPMDWARTLEHLSGLRTLALDGVYDNTITQEQILSVLLASPNIETLTIIDMEIKGHPSSLSQPVEPISLPQLRAIALITDGSSTIGLLHRIRPPPDMIEFDIRPKDFPSHDVATSFWQETMAPWVPVVQRLYLDSDKPGVHLEPQAASCFQAFSKNILAIEFTDLTMAAALLWIQDVIGTVADVEDGPGGFQMWTKDSAFESDEVLAILQKMPGVTEISVEPANRLSRPSLEALFNVLAEPTTDSIDTPEPRPTFPALQTLTIPNWMWELDDFMNMIQRRDLMRSTCRQQVPGLTLDISPLRPWQLPWREKKIISFSDATALLELDGVRGLRMSCVMEHSGTLAVIWDEAESSPAWG